MFATDMSLSMHIINGVSYLHIQYMGSIDDKLEMSYLHINFDVSSLHVQVRAEASIVIIRLPIARSNYLLIFVMKLID